MLELEPEAELRPVRVAEAPTSAIADHPSERYIHGACAGLEVSIDVAAGVDSVKQIVELLRLRGGAMQRQPLASGFELRWRNAGARNG